MSILQKHAVALIDGRAEKSIIHALEKYADKVLTLPAFPALSAPVSAHADMLVWYYEKTVFTYTDYRTLAPEIFDELENLGYTVRTVSAPTDREYPCDVALNCASLGKNIIANTKHCAPEIKALAEQRGISLLHTNQGYAKCSTVVLSDNAIITSDASIAAVAHKNSIDTLTISSGSVALPPYEYGFIGGASGADSQNVFFCGNIDLHPDAEKIRGFCEKHQKQIVCLSDSPLADVGTVMFFDR